MSKHTRSSRESVVELHDYHVRALLTAFEPESDDSEPYIVFTPGLSTFSVSTRWGDVWEIGTTIVSAIGQPLGRAVMENRFPSIVEPDRLYFFGVKSPPEFAGDPTTLKQVLDGSWKHDGDVNEQGAWVLGVLSELIDYHAEADTERADEIADDLCKVFDIVRPLFPKNTEGEQ